MVKEMTMDELGYVIVDKSLSDVPFSSKRQRIFVPQVPSEAVYVCDGTESLWQVAGRPEVYNNNNYWWILADVNDIHGIFSAMYGKIERGTELRVPAIDQVRRVISSGR